MSLQNQFPGKHDVQDVHSPMIYVQEEIAWQYKYLAIDLRRDPMPDEELLDELGAGGWELASMIIHDQLLHIYFKRLKNR
jgi:hypothetical protein